MYDEHFEAITLDGKRYDFGGRCNLVKYNSPYVCVFKDNMDGILSDTLGIIPYSNISAIIRVAGGTDA